MSIFELPSGENEFKMVFAATDPNANVYLIKGNYDPVRLTAVLNTTVDSFPLVCTIRTIAERGIYAFHIHYHS